MRAPRGLWLWTLALAATVLLAGVFVLIQAQQTGPLPTPPAPRAREIPPAPPGGAYQPENGQPGKDVVWVPTAQSMVDAMLGLAAVTARDYLIDLGSGDGRTVIAAATRGARALGIEYNPDMVDLSKRNAEAAGVAGRARFAKADIFESDYSDATVVTMFLLPELNLRLRPTLLELKPGTRLVSNTFTMDDWIPDGLAMAADGCRTWCMALLWIVPAHVAGTWALPQGTLTLSQTFQMIAGTMKTPRGTFAVENGRVRGTLVSFTVNGTHYVGVVDGDLVAGVAGQTEKPDPWRATRVKRGREDRKGANR